MMFLLFATKQILTFPIYENPTTVSSMHAVHRHKAGREIVFSLPYLAQGMYFVGGAMNPD